MPALVLVEVEIHNPELYEDYKKLSLPAVEAFGGKFVVRGAQTESLEGDWNPQRLVVLEFPSVERAKEWYNSEQYTTAKNIRFQASKGKMLVVESV
ncbi:MULTISPECIES: DUF1330 domain-containing protein [Belliella]|uniref:DUF1330 domain-containing protein n=2 Tax=Belliella TaxID=232244 RepID=I3Z8N7_BELBD|nr:MULTISPECIES: DUF1330 domain-containing protein [Belliella]AFL85605.1 hypothetical protein Belba_3088 [Belliella baltica DSM 15883]MCH7406787.1 DUF1330 domain-containing protein [Belliella aquatica]GGC48463.1 hypothetical protein GCM10010993_28680 [Belliella aquatica]